MEQKFARDKGKRELLKYCTFSQKEDQFVSKERDFYFGLSLIQKKMFSRRRKYRVMAKVIEGRHIYGNDVRPYCKVQVLDRSECTERAFHTNNPWWNETFSFYDLDFGQEDLVEEYVWFRVLNPLRLRKDVILGEFQLSLSEIYQQLNHGYVNKWVELTHIRQGIQYQSGFLKVSVLVLTNDEEGPDLDINPNVKDEDIESNLLRSRGTFSKPARMVIHAYRAENLPKMDFGISDTLRQAISRERGPRIDPYLEVFFAGKTVKTKAIISDDNPEWNESLEIEFRFPSVATKVYFALKDWDRTSSDDLVAYSSLDLSEISSSDVNGFLPTFGPSWLSFTSEEKNETDSLYHFRGRVLLSLKVYVPDETGSPRDKLPKRLEVCGIRKRFVLYVVFLEAIFTQEICGPIRFGISMGPYGGVKSWTEVQYAVPNEDGYPILRWGLEKQILTVQSEWEDYLYRYRALLDIFKVADLLEYRLINLKDYLKTKNGSPNVVKKLILDILSQTQSEIHGVLQSLPELQPDDSVPETELDVNLRQERLRKFGKMLEDVNTLDVDSDTIVEELDSLLKTIRIMAKEPQLNIPDMELITMSKKKVIGSNHLSVLELLKRSGIDEKDYAGKEELVLLRSQDDGGRPIVLLRLKCVFGLESRLKTPAHCFGDRGVTVNHFVQTYENQLLLCGSWRTTGNIICTWPAWSNPDGSMSLPKEKFNIQTNLNFIGDWFVQSASLKHNFHYDKIQGDSNQVIDEGWFYGTSFKSDIRSFPAKGDTFRKRCWRRRVFVVEPELWLPELPDWKKSGLEPKTFLVYEGYRQFRLFIHVYQGRDLVSADSNGLSDPYLKASVNGVSAKTRTVRESLAPVWDQTLVLNVSLPDSQDDLKMTPVLIEVFDRDKLDNDEWLGYAIVNARVIQIHEAYYAPRLNWLKLNYSQSEKGQILAAFDMVEVGHKFMLSEVGLKSNVIYIPEGIRPKMNQYGLEVIFWSVSNLKFSHFIPILKPILEFRCGKYVIRVQSQTRSDVVPISFAKIELPKEVAFWGPITMVLRDSRFFGKQPVIGAVEIENFDRFLCKVSPQTRKSRRKSGSGRSSERSTSGSISSHEDTDDAIEYCDWWVRYEASIGNREAKRRLKTTGQDVFQIYHSELEKQDVFRGFTDMIESFEIYRGKETEGTLKKSGEIKCAVKIYPLPEEETPNQPKTFQLSKCLSYFRTISEVIVRVYVISGFDLAPKDINGKADPYIVVEFGNLRKDTRDRYLSGTLNPVFGEMFELKGPLSESRELSVSIWDHDTLTPDDLIGQTVIDLESRCLTKYRATCGLAWTYRETWRDCQKPSEILESVCHLWDLPKPKYVTESCLFIGRKKYRLKDFEKVSVENHPKERLALHLLHMLTLVPEHVETRFLYHPKIPCVSRGKLRMWVDIFPTSWGPPGPEVHITPRKPENYVLRVVIYDTYDVDLQEKTLLGERMSDIYVKGIFSGDIQSTDVHYRSLDGEGNFNYRFVFPFTYDVTERMIVYEKKDRIWSLEETSRKSPPVLTIQVWDADIISRDDFLGQLEINLLDAWKPAKSRNWCNLYQLGYYESQDNSTAVEKRGNIFQWIFNFLKVKKNRYQRLRRVETKMNLLKTRHVRGFWPFYRKRVDSNYDLAGKVEMEIEILSEADAIEKPVGKGREEPNMYPHLEEPKRPETSFLWFLNPIKILKYSLWRNHKRFIITVILIAMLVLFGLLMIYKLPEIIMNRLFPSC